MNDRVRRAVKHALQQRQLTQAELARRVGTERPNLHRLLSGNSGQVPELWQRVLDELEMEIIAVPRHLLAKLEEDEVLPRESKT